MRSILYTTSTNNTRKDGPLKIGKAPPHILGLPLGATTNVKRGGFWHLSIKGLSKNRFNELFDDFKSLSTLTNF